MVDLWGTRLQARGTGASGERRSLCLRAENLAITPNGSGIRGRVAGDSIVGTFTTTAPMLTSQHGRWRMVREQP